MCRIDNCDRHEFDRGLCLDHLKESLGVIKVQPKRKTRKKKVDAVEVDTNDDTTEMETRDE